MKFRNENLNVAYNTLHEWTCGAYGHTKVSCDTLDKRLSIVTNKLELVEAATSPEHYFNEAEWDNYESEEEAKLLLLEELFTHWEWCDDFEEEIEELESIIYSND